jgi:ABC-2 type transport system ATP-binding protein
MVLGLTRPDAGDALVDGSPYAALPWSRRIVGAVTDRLGAFPGMTAVRHLQVVAAQASFDEGRIPAVLDLVELSDAAGRRVGSFSTGMRQRLALAAALLGEPRILILDEPSSGLDPAGIRWIRNLMRDLARGGAAVFVSTHQLAELASIVDRLILIDRGRILADRATEDLLVTTGQHDLESAVFAVTGSEPVS